MKGMWVGYDVGCTMGLTCGHGAWQIDRQSNGSMWNSYSFQPVGQWMSYSFTDLGAEGCCRSLNALLKWPCSANCGMVLSTLKYFSLLLAGGGCCCYCMNVLFDFGTLSTCRTPIFQNGPHFPKAVGSQDPIIEPPSTISGAPGW